MPDSYFDPSMLKLQSNLNQSNPTISTNMPGNQGTGNAMNMNDGAPEKDSVGQEDEITKLVSKLYTPGHEIADKFNEVWNQMPQREKPSVLRRIVASMVGGGKEGIKGASEVMDEPYNEARSDWMDKLKMLQPALSDERYNNANERMIATNAATQATANKRIGETERHNQETETLNKSKAEVTKDRAAVYRYKAENPDHKFVEDEQGQLMALDPKSGGMKYVLNEDGVPVKSLKNLDAREKENLDIKARKDVANIQGKNQIEAAKVRGNEARQTEEVKAKGRIEVKENKDASGKVVSKTTTVYDTAGNVTGTKTESTTTKPVAPKEVPSNVSKVRMETPPDKDGKVRTIMVPMDKVAEAEQRGAKRVK